MMTRRHALIFILCAGLIAGCGNESDLSDLRDFTQNTFRGQKPAVEPLPTVAPHAIFTYDPAGRKDPFNPTNLAGDLTDEPPPEPVVLDEGDAPDRSRRKQPLEEFALGDLAFKGVLMRQDRRSAVVKDPNNFVHLIEVGDYLGRFHGRVTAISEQAITLTETRRAANGRWEQQETKLTSSE